MPFTGKATYSAGATLPELAEDVSDLIAIAASAETPLLDALGDSTRVARSTVHEWIEDAPLSNRLAVASVISTTLLTFADVTLLQVGDQLAVEGGGENILVTGINTANGQVTVTRGYGGTVSTAVGVGSVLINLGNAALEGDDARAARFTNRTRQSNWTQIFNATCEVSGSELAVRQVGVRDELDYQKAMRVRELLRDLENCVINGRAPTANQVGSSTVRRTMRGLLSFAETNSLFPGDNGLPEDTALSEIALNAALRYLWEQKGAMIDTILVGGAQKRAINGFVAANRRFYSVNETFKDMVSSYESDFGVCRVVLSRYVPSDAVMLLDSSRIDVLPLAGRSFQYKSLANTGDRITGQVIGEYTLEVRNANTMGVIRGLS
jgi:Family of unknown function (DUF5309)